MITTFNDNLILIAYSCTWFIFLYIYKYFYGRFTLGYVLISLYAFLSLISIETYNSEYAYLYFENNLTSFPLVYLFIMMFIMFIPIITLKEKNIQYLCVPEIKICTFLCVFMGFFSLLRIIELLPSIRVGFNMLMASDYDSLVEIYENSSVEHMTKRQMSGTFNIIGIIANLANSIGPLLFYTYMIQSNRKAWVVFFLLMNLLLGVLSGVATVSRAKIIINLFTLFLLFFFFKPFLDISIKKKIVKLFIVFGSLVLFVISLITIARVESKNKTSVTFNVSRYLGESTIIFDQFCLDANGTREGYQTIPFFKKMLGYPIYTEEELRFKYNHMKIDNSRFYSYVGDYVLDYGPTIALILFVFLSFSSKLFLKHDNGLTYGQVIVVYMIFRFCSAYYQAPFTGIGGNIAFLFEILLVILFQSKIISTTKIYRKE